MRTVTSERGHTSCEDIADLMPWYVNGTLNASDRSLVDAHCSHCAACSAAVNLEQRIASSIRAPRDNIGQSPHAAWQRFEALLDKEGPRRPPRSFRGTVRSAAFGVVMAAQAAAIVALAVLLFLDRSNQEAPRFQTLTSVDNTLSVGTPLVRIAFDSGVTEAEAAAVAGKAGGTIVAGPSPNNVYTFAFRAGDREVLDKKVTQLRRHSHVLLAEPVVLDGSP
jgi:anti-sigma factor RsiW